MMKKMMLIMAVICLLLAGCGKKEEEPDAATKATEQSDTETEAAQEEEPVVIEQEEEPAAVINPLPDSTMDNLTDAILAISLEEGDAYVDDTGVMQMDVKIYTYDKYDMVDISMLKEGDTLVTYAGEIKVTSVERNDRGTVFINGGLEEGGMDLFTDDTGIYFETGFNDIKSWYEIGEATIRVSADFKGVDNADPQQEVILYPGDFLTGAVTDYYFTPNNTTIRVQEGQIVEMTRRYTP